MGGLVATHAKNVRGGEFSVLEKIKDDASSAQV